MTFKRICEIVMASSMLLSSSLSFSQGLQVSRSGSHEEFKARMAAVFEKLDQSKIQTGLLHDKVVSISQIAEYTGLSANKVVTPAIWKQIYFEMHRSSLGESNFPSFAQLNHRSRSSLREGVFPIAIMNFRYNKIKENAVEKGLLGIENEQYVEVANPPESPYEEKTVFAATALQTRAHTANPRFLLDNGFYFSNTGEPLQSLEIDFDDGQGYRRIDLGSSVSVNYGSGGQKQIRIRATYEGQTRQSVFLFEVDTFAARQLSSQPDISWVGEVSSYPYLGQNAVYDAFIFLGNGNSVITRPLLFAEGFDLDNSLGWPEIWALLNEENLAPTLQAAGYDIVIMNYGDATDYIQRNALAVATLVEKLNDEKTGSELLVVTGASMGGLVGRYALTWMEENSIAHETRLFISFDTPHQGANIPLGDQYFAAFFAEYEASVAALLDALNSASSQQMLAYHHLDEPNYGQNALRLQLFSELASMGDYPSTPGLQIAAVSNGSGAGTAGGQVGNNSVLLQPGDQMLDWDYFSLLVAIESQVWAVPDISPQTQIFHGLVDLIFPLPDDELDVFVSGTLPYDNPQGGSSDTQQQIVDTVVAAGMGPISTDFPDHCFIPTISALDLRDGNGNPLSLSHDLNNDPNLLAKTPFDAIYYPQGTTNQEHVEITVGNAAFLLEQILGVGPQPPAAPTDLAASSTGATTIDLTWTDNSGDEDGFKIERHDGSGTFVEIASVAADVTQFSDTNLTENTTYTYRVRAFNINGHSNYSNEAATTPVDPNTNLALSQPVTASNGHPSFPVSNVLDGSTGTFWGTLVAGDEWIRVDFESAAPQGRVIVKWNNNFFATDYEWQVSDDDVNWTTVYSTSSGSGGNEQFEFPQATAPFGRLYMNAFNTNILSIRELEVYSGATGPPVAAEFRINSGGNNYTTTGGELFVADKPFSAGDFGYNGGVSINLPQPVAGTNDDPLFQSLRGNNAPFDYTFDGLASGDYQVELYFQEPQVSASGLRQIDVLMEGAVIFDNLDIFAEAGGKFTALTKTTTITVTDGRLEIQFVPVVRAALVCAIAVIEQSSTAEPAAKRALETTESSFVPMSMRLLQNYPNPFNPTTRISFELDKAGPVSLTVFNVIGQLVRTLTERDYQPGTYTLEWDARDDTGLRLPSGVYVYKLETEDQAIVRKMILIK